MQVLCSYCRPEAAALGCAVELLLGQLVQCEVTGSDAAQGGKASGTSAEVGHTPALHRRHHATPRHATHVTVRHVVVRQAAAAPCMRGSRQRAVRAGIQVFSGNVPTFWWEIPLWKSRYDCGLAPILYSTTATPHGRCRLPVGAQGGLSPPGELRLSRRTSHTSPAFLPTLGFPCVSLYAAPTRACPPPLLTEYRLRPGCSALLGWTFLLELVVPDSLVRLLSPRPCPPALPPLAACFQRSSSFPRPYSAPILCLLSFTTLLLCQLPSFLVFHQAVILLSP